MPREKLSSIPEFDRLIVKNIQKAIATMSQQFDIPSEKMIESEKILEDNYFG